MVGLSPEMGRKRVQQRSRDTSPFNTNLDTEFAAKQHVKSFVIYLSYNLLFTRKKPRDVNAFAVH